MQPRRAFWLANAGAMGVNPDQRIHEDARKLCELSADLASDCCRHPSCSAPSPACSGCCQRFLFRIGDTDYAIPGFMLWAAILYASAGSLLSYWVGRSLINRNADRYAREADLRFSLVRVNEHVDDISLAAARRMKSAASSCISATCSCRDPAHRPGPYQSHLGHRGLRLGHHRGAHPGGGAAVFHRER
jgi:ABC-type uncharacterized transport system fused permease/ATPase subunit